MKTLPASLAVTVALSTALIACGGTSSDGAAPPASQGGAAGSAGGAAGASGGTAGTGGSSGAAGKGGATAGAAGSTGGTGGSSGGTGGASGGAAGTGGSSAGTGGSIAGSGGAGGSVGPCVDGGAEYGAPGDKACNSCQTKETAAGGCCADETTKCNASDDCVGFVQCVVACKDAACKPKCESDKPKGVLDGKSYIACLFGAAPPAVGACGVACGD